MTDTELVRSRLRTFVGTFTADDFADIKSITSVITKLYRMGELERAGRTTSKAGRPINVYKVLKLREPKPKKLPIARKEKVYVEPLYVTLWKRVYPDLFRIPDFSGYPQTIRKNAQEFSYEEA